MGYDMNVKSIVLGYMNWVGDGDLHAMAVLLDLTNGRKLTRNFSCYQQVVGEKIRDYIIKEMELAPKMELKATFRMTWDGSAALVEIIIYLYQVMNF